jgi:hypothetical protein
MRIHSSGEEAISVRFGGGVPEFSRSVPLFSYRLSTWLTRPNGTVAAKGSYSLEFL